MKQFVLFLIVLVALTDLGEALGICKLPYETGPCRASIRRYYYDSNVEECKGFTYGGCRGNSNNFHSKKACEKVCGQPDCNASPVTGFCKAYIPRFYYDSKAGECKMFIYGGCGGNSNRFETKQECKKACGCNAPSVTGFCRGYFPRYYYKSSSKKCEKFIYGGCGGNSNKFKSKFKCMKACM